MHLQELLPENLLRIFDYLDAIDLTRCTKVSKKFREISLDKRLWSNIYINLCSIRIGTDFQSDVLAKFIGFIINNGCSSLEVWKHIDHQNAEYRSFPQENDLKHLRLFDGTDSFGGNNDHKPDLFINLIKSCHALEKLSIEGMFLC